MIEKALGTIRKFRKGDIDRILAIEAQAAPKTPYPKEILLRLAAKLPDGFLVVESGEDIVGYIIFDANGHVLSMAVKIAHRKRGVARMLFLRALKCAGQGLWLEVRSRNSGAIAFYKKMGMKIVGRLPNYYGDDDALIMMSGNPKHEIRSSRG